MIPEELWKPILDYERGQEDVLFRTYNSTLDVWLYEINTPRRMQAIKESELAYETPQGQFIILKEKV